MKRTNLSEWKNFLLVISPTERQTRGLFWGEHRRLSCLSVWEAVQFSLLGRLGRQKMIVQ
jgi:hypothetical protein